MSRSAGPPGSWRSGSPLAPSPPATSTPQLPAPWPSKSSSASKPARAPSCRPPEGDLDHEPGARPDGVVLHPDPSAVKADVFGDQRQAEARALPAAPALPGGRAPEEPLEDGFALLGGHAG